MKYLLILALMSFGAMADTGTNSSALNSVSNTYSPVSVAHMNIGGGDILPSYVTMSATSVTCPSNQFIVAVAHTKSGLSGSGAPKIGSDGTAGSLKFVFPFGDNGKCAEGWDIINRSAELEYSRKSHNLCMGYGMSFKKEGIFLDGNFFDNNPSYISCRDIFVLLKVAYAQP